MAGETIIMNLVVRGINRYAGCRAGDAGSRVAKCTVRGFNHACTVIGVGMTGKVRAMAGGTITSTNRNGDCLPIGGLQCATGFVACGTCVMDLVIRAAQRNTGCRARSGGMTSGTGCVRRHQGCVIAAKSGSTVARGTVAAYSIDGIMVDGASGIRCRIVTGVTAGTGILKHANGRSVHPGAAGVITMIGVDMAESTIITVHIDHQVCVYS